MTALLIMLLGVAIALIGNIFWSGLEYRDLKREITETNPASPDRTGPHAHAKAPRQQ